LPLSIVIAVANTVKKLVIRITIRSPPKI